MLLLLLISHLIFSRRIFVKVLYLFASAQTVCLLAFVWFDQLCLTADSYIFWVVGIYTTAFLRICHLVKWVRFFHKSEWIRTSEVVWIWKSKDTNCRVIELVLTDFEVLSIFKSIYNLSKSNISNCSTPCCGPREAMLHVPCLSTV